jgi:predicted ATP-grasp superfamily ATP-dependent carboligase
MTTVGPFELSDELPSIEGPRLLLALQPWIDIGSVGSMALAFIEQRWEAQEIGRLSRPGTFYDFSRYRPMLFREGGERRVAVPNTVLHHAKAPDGQQWLLLHALEPHANGEDYADGLMGLLQHFGVRQYYMVGSMYAPVPHTRPPVASGGSNSDALRDRLQHVGIKESNYEGPTTILATLPARALAEGIETATVIVQCPAYAQMERDYRGLHALLELLSGMFELQLDLNELGEESARQSAAMDESMAQNPQLAAMVLELERAYDSEAGARSTNGEQTKLSPELEGFLKDIEGRLEG